MKTETNSKIMNISKFTKAQVLAALHNGSKVQGMGIFQATGRPMTTEEAQKEIDDREGDLYFDYLHGKVMKIDLSGDELNPRLYDRDNGEGAAEAIISKLQPVV